MLQFTGGIMFIGRSKELDGLDRLYSKGGFQFVVVYGRRRVGKTTLLSEFSKGKPSLFYVAPQHDDKGALRTFSESIHAYLGEKGLAAYASWEDALLRLARVSETERMVLILDEFPYLAQANRSLPSIMQNVIDHHYKAGNMFLVVCGSSMSFMEEGVLGSKSPLYGRATGVMRVEPMGFTDSAAFFSRYGCADKLACYGVLGGVPKYLEAFDDSLTLRQNIITRILDDTSLLYEEPKNFLKEELREIATYNAIIEAIAGGAGRLNEIAGKAGMETDRCAKYLATLRNLHLVIKDTPVATGNNKKSTLYRISDNFFAFWYRFVFENQTLVEMGDGQALFDLFIKDGLADYLGPVFESVCLECLWLLNQKRRLPFVFSRAGRWWGTDHKRREQAEIDILAYHKEQAIFAECKFRNERMGASVLDDLRRKADLFTGFEKRWYWLFSKSGFTSGLRQAAESDPSVQLIDLHALERHLAER
jgi:AAA+ ATPase superfamily predicted ATPase